MKSCIEVVAELRAGTSTVTVIRGGGHFAGRQTGACAVHLVGTAAGPLGGDEVTVRLRVGAGARLHVRTAAATVVLPGPERPDSRLLIDVQVDDAAQLVLEPEPTVVCRRAVHEAITTVALAGSGRARILEEVVLGRAGETGGSWTGHTGVTRDGSPVLRHTVRSSLLAARALAALVDTGAGSDSGAGSDTGERTAGTAGNAVAMPLAAGGMLVTAFGPNVSSTRADLLRCAEQAVTVGGGTGRSAAARPIRR